MTRSFIESSQKWHDYDGRETRDAPGCGRTTKLAFMQPRESKVNVQIVAEIGWWVAQGIKR
jgi:hypothetical protein